MHIFLLADFYREADLRSLNEVKRGQHIMRFRYMSHVHKRLQLKPIVVYPVGLEVYIFVRAFTATM